MVRSVLSVPLARQARTELMVRSDHKVPQAQRALLVQPVPSDPPARTEWTERLDPKVQRDQQVLSVQ